MRWFIRIFLGLLALLILLIAIVQIVLWTNIPRNLVVENIQQELGLRVTTQRLVTGWTGKTTLHEVSLALPMAEQSFLQVKTLKVKHTSLIGLLLGRALSVDSIELDDPTIIVRQDPQGQWNLIDVAQLLARAGGGQTAQESQQTGVPKLPAVTLSNGIIKISDNQNHHATLPLSVHGSAESALVWKYNVQIADAISLVGELAPGSNWQHQITLKASHLDTLFDDWGIPSYDADLAGQWRGRIDDGKLSGLFSLDHFTAREVPAAGDIKVTGAVELTSAANITTLRPRRLILTTTNPTLPDIRILQGSVIADSNGIHADALQLAVLGGFAVLDARFDPRTTSADLTARWNNLELSSTVSHSGSLTASLRTPFEGHPSIKLDLQSNGNTSSASWQAELALWGEGQSWQSIDWSLTAPTLKYTSGNSVEFTHLTGHIRQRGAQIDLTDLFMPQRPHLVSRAAINLQNHNWYFWLDAAGERTIDSTTLPVACSLNAWGNQDVYTLKSFNFSIGQALVWAGGSYDRRLPSPVNLDVYLLQSPQVNDSTFIHGQFAGNFHVSGLLFPEDVQSFNPHLDVKGKLTSNDLLVLDRAIGDINIQFDGIVNGTQADITTSQMSLFQGHWYSKIHWAMNEPSDLHIEVQNLPLDQLAQFAKVSNISGQLLNGSCDIRIPHPFYLTQLRMSSQFELGAVNVAGVAVNQASAHLTLQDGFLKLDSLTAHTGPGSLTASSTYDLNNLQRLGLNIDLDQWGFGSANGASLRLSASTKLDINLKQKSAVGPLTSSADLLLDQAPIAHTELTADLRGRLLNFDKIEGQILNGQLHGSAHVDLDRPLRAQGRIEWSNIDAAAIGVISPALAGLKGRYSGTITIAPAVDPRPLAPVRIDINMAAQDGRFNSIEIGDGLVALHAIAYADTDRAILDHSDIDIAGGVVHIWARVGRALISETAQVDFSNLQLDQIAHADRHKGGAMPGLLSGKIALIGSGGDLNQLVASGKISLVQTDLGNFGPIAALYRAMNLGSGGSKPAGTGSANLALERGALKVTNFRFYNRGVDARGIFNVGPDVFAANIPIGGQVAGTVRPLKNSRISVLADLDEYFSSVQGELTTINITGTTNTPSYTLAAFSQIGGAVREFIQGDSSGQ